MQFLDFLSGFLMERAHAADPDIWGQYCHIFGPACGDGRAFLIDFAGRTIQFVFILIGGATVLAVLYGSIRLIFGGEGAKDEAKKIIQYALTGLVLAIMGWSVMFYIEGLLVPIFNS